MTKDLVGASPWEQDLYHHLVSHVDNERELLVEYQKAASESQSAAFRYLAALIIEEEMRHHRVFQELAESLRTDAELRPEAPTIPRLDHWGSDPEHIVEITERLVKQERQDLDELRRLSKELKEVKDTTLWELLVRLMESDTEKHIQILTFVRKHAARPLV